MPHDEGLPAGGAAPETHADALVRSQAAATKLAVFTRQWSQSQMAVRAYLASFLGNSIAVDDCLQEVAVVVWNKGPWDAEPPAFLGYSLACARRIALAARRKQRDPKLEILSPDAAQALADRVAFRENQDASHPDERVAALRACLAKLQPAQRELLESRYSGQSGSELKTLCERDGKSMDALYKTLERLRGLLRACVTRHQAHPQ